MRKSDFFISCFVFFVMLALVVIVNGHTKNGEVSEIFISDFSLPFPVSDMMNYKKKNERLFKFYFLELEYYPI